jgi:hypothetical protein
MPKRRRLTVEDQRRDVRERVFRQLRSLLEVYWEMCGTLAAADQFDAKLAMFDAKLAMRMMRHREHALRLLEFVMPEPRLGELLDGPEAQDQSRSVH